MWLRSYWLKHDAGADSGGGSRSRQELAYVHKIEQTRTSQQVAQAQIDDKEEDLFIFSGVIGSRFAKSDLPLRRCPRMCTTMRRC